MLVELAIGDAYGAGFEYAPASMVRKENTLFRYARHPHHRITPGCYTDDTQMTLAVAEAIVNGDQWTRENLANRFVEVFKRDPREGYATRFYEFLKEIDSGSEFLTRIQPTSEKSGAAMRAVPIGVFHTPREVYDRAVRQAEITHDTDGGTKSAAAVALMTHYFLYQIGPKRELPAFLSDYVDWNWSQPWNGAVGPRGMDSVRAAVHAIMESDRLSMLLKRCIRFGGDVDTVATIALGAASSSREMVKDLPPILFATLENGKFGRDYIRELDVKLLNKVNTGG